MLRLFVLIFIQGFFIFAIASTDNTSSFNVAQFVRESKIGSGFSPRALSISLVHSPTTHAEFDTAGESGHYVSNSSFGIGARQSFTPTHSLGYSWGTTLESLNNFREISVNGNSFTNSAGDTHLYFLNVDPSVSYGIGGTGYILAGFNYAFPLTKNILGTELSGSFGYQAGGGLHVSSKWNIEAIYRDIGFRGERLASSGLPAKDLDRLSYSGLLLRASYVLN